MVHTVVHLQTHTTFTPSFCIAATQTVGRRQSLVWDHFQWTETIYNTRPSDWWTAGGKLGHFPEHLASFACMVLESAASSAGLERCFSTTQLAECALQLEGENAHFLRKAFA